MLGKASDIKISDPLWGPSSVRGWIREHPDFTVLDIQISASETDYFYIIYKETESNENS